MSEERKTIYLCLAHMSEDGMEQKYVKEAFDTNWVVPIGPNVNAFEQDLSNFANSKTDNTEPLDRKVVCLSAGTAAVHLALIACGVQVGDEVCVQSFTFCASSHPITYLGAKPVFIGSEKDTWNMDPELLEKAILDRKEKTGKYPKAIVPVALYGMPYRIDRIMEIADKYGITVIEDAAEGMGSRFNGQVLGTFGKFGVLSFNGNKMITTSGGGALICRNAEDVNQIMWYATQARDAYPYYQHTAIGFNYRMSNVVAGVVRGQFPYLNEHIAQKKAIYERYKEGLKGLPVSMNPIDFENSEPNYWLSCLIIDKEAMCKQVRGEQDVCYVKEAGKTCPTEILEAIASINAEGRPIWKPMHMQPIYRLNPFVVRDGNGRARSNAYIAGGVADVGMDIFTRGLCLPSDNKMTAEQQDRIIEVIRACFE